jgi:hypothetical protein
LDSAKADRPAPAALDPELRQILGPPPLFEGESEAAYHQLYDRLRSAVSPKDVIEEIWVRDLADLVWETNRLRRLKAKLMDAARWQGMAAVLESVGIASYLAKQDASAYASGDSRAKAKVDPMLGKAKADRAIIEAQTLAARISDFERFDRLIMSSESRRNAVLREIDRHREAIALRVREALTEIEDAEFEEVSTPDGQARE